MHIFNEQWFWLLVSYNISCYTGVQNEMIMKSFFLVIDDEQSGGQCYIITSPI